MDTMFNNGHSVIIPENKNSNFDVSNDGGSLSSEALKLLMNKRKLAANGISNAEHSHEENESAKRLCSINGYHQHEQKA